VETDVTWPASEGDGPTTFYIMMELVAATEEEGEIWKFGMFISEDAVARIQAAASQSPSKPALPAEESQK
jgi:hypothetical protein